MASDERVEAAAWAVNRHYADSPDIDDDHREVARKVLAAAGVLDLEAENARLRAILAAAPSVPKGTS